MNKLDEFFEEYAATYAFETELRPLREKSNHWIKKPFKAIAANLGRTNSQVFDSVWRRECSECSGSGKIERMSYGEMSSTDARPVLESCLACSGTGYIEPYDLMITFVRRNDKLWNVSLYSTKDDVDCGSIAKSFGGGGHKQAAGMIVKELPFEY